MSHCDLVSQRDMERHPLPCPSLRCGACEAVRAPMARMADQWSGSSAARVPSGEVLVWRQPPYEPGSPTPLEDSGPAGILLSTGTLSTSVPGRIMSPYTPCP